MPEDLVTALEDIAESWQTRDAKWIRARFPATGTVSVFEGGHFSRKSPAVELSRSVAVGVTQLDTVKFLFDKPVRLNPDRYFAGGTHQFKDANGVSQKVYVSYVLERVKERWTIAEYGVSNKPVTQHAAPPPKEERFGPGE